MPLITSIQADEAKGILIVQTKSQRFALQGDFVLLFEALDHLKEYYRNSLTRVYRQLRSGEYGETMIYKLS